MAAFAKLTEAQRERLEMLAEEAGEVIQAVTKILRHGYDSYHPDNPGITNKMRLGFELKDFEAVAFQVYKLDDVAMYLDVETLAARWNKKRRYTHHQDQEGGDA